MTVIILNHDPARPESQAVLDKKGAPRIRYKLAQESIRSLCHAQAQAARIFFAAGCERAIMPCADRVIFKAGEVADQDLEQFIAERNFLSIKTPLSSAHPQGGCRMGNSSSDSVTDSFGRVHGRPWLRVADASLFPKSSHVNPYLTIMALADRGAEQLEREIG
jgi:choline dehydrogenase-like flavoprotein